MSDEAKAAIWDEAVRTVRLEIRAIPHWFNPEDGYGEFDLQPLGPDETTERGAWMAVQSVFDDIHNPYREES